MGMLKNKKIIICAPRGSTALQVHELLNGEDSPTIQIWEMVSDFMIHVILRDENITVSSFVNLIERELGLYKINSVHKVLVTHRPTPSVRNLSRKTDALENMFTAHQNKETPNDIFDFYKSEDRSLNVKSTFVRKDYVVHVYGVMRRKVLRTFEYKTGTRLRMRVRKGTRQVARTREKKQNVQKPFKGKELLPQTYDAHWFAMELVIKTGLAALLRKVENKEMEHKDALALFKVRCTEHQERKKQQEQVFCMKPIRMLIKPKPRVFDPNDQVIALLVQQRHEEQTQRAIMYQDVNQRIEQETRLTPKVLPRVFRTSEPCKPSPPMLIATMCIMSPIQMGTYRFHLLEQSRLWVSVNMCPVPNTDRFERILAQSSRILSNRAEYSKNGIKRIQHRGGGRVFELSDCQSDWRPWGWMCKFPCLPIEIGGLQEVGNYFKEGDRILLLRNAVRHARINKEIT